MVAAATDGTNLVGPIVTAVEVKDDRLMLTRNNDYIMIGSKFPRLTKSEPGARLKEIKKLLAALS